MDTNTALPESPEPVRALDASHAQHVQRFASRELLHNYGVAPLSSDEATCRFLVADMAVGGSVAHELAMLLGKSAEISLGGSDIISASIEALYAIRPSRSTPSDATSSREDLAALAKEPPVIRYCAFLMREALARRASDLHLDATSDHLRVRLRVDGSLTDFDAPPPAPPAAIISRFKLLADLDITKRRLPQDGRFTFRHLSGDTELRVASLPTPTGEALVIRVLGASSGLRSLGDLGMPPDMERSFRASVLRTSGLVLVCGPTGSGKTTTLYASLMLRRDRPEKVITVEDPVEQPLPFATQLSLASQTNLTFASALRSALRHDPDVILIGEIRDSETADIAVRAALTGHLVMATVHTSDTLGAVFRLRDLGVPAFLIADTLSAVLGQRLVRTLCTHCATGDVTDDVTPSCGMCHGTGYRGRIGVFEFLPVGRALRAGITAGAVRDDLSAMASASGMIPFSQSADHLLAQGLTSLEELSRVLA